MSGKGWTSHRVRLNKCVRVNQVNTFENYQNRLPTQWYLFLIINKYIYTNMIVLIGDNILKMFSYLKTVVTFLVKFL